MVSGSATAEEKDFPFLASKGVDLKAFVTLRKNFSRPSQTLSYETDSPLSNLFHFKGTALKAVLKLPEFYALFLLHILFVVVYYGKLQGTASGVGDSSFAELEGWPKMSTSLVLIPGTVMSILVAFYVNQTFSRYFEQFFKKADLCILDIANLLRTFIPNDSNGNGLATRASILKQILAAQILGYTSLPGNRQAGMDVWAWESLASLGLMTPEEIEELVAVWNVSESSAYAECLLAANRQIWALLTAGKISQRDQCLILQSKIDELRSHFLYIISYASAPIPFAYYHLFNAFLELYLVLLAYVFVFQSPWWSIPGYFLILLAILGFREIGNAMSDPFGSDDVDIPVFTYVERVYRESSLLLDVPVAYVDEPEFMK